MVVVARRLRAAALGEEGTPDAARSGTFQRVRPSLSNVNLQLYGRTRSALVPDYDVARIANPLYDSSSSITLHGPHHHHHHHDEQHRHGQHQARVSRVQPDGRVESHGCVRTELQSLQGTGAGNGGLDLSGDTAYEYMRPAATTTTTDTQSGLRAARSSTHTAASDNGQVLTALTECPRLNICSTRASCVVHADPVPLALFQVALRVWCQRIRKRATT